jgi:hypothetical protein
MNSENLRDLTPETAIRNFPDVYNNMKNELVAEIERLNGVIATKDTEINNLRTAINTALSNLRAEYLAMFDQLDNKFVKKETE